MKLFTLIISITFCLQGQIYNAVQIDTIRLEKELKSFYKKNRLASFSFGMFQGMKFNKQFSFGYQNLSKKIKSSSNTYYALASVTKPITAALIINAVDSNRLKYSDFAKDYLENIPDNITIRDLLVHDTGFKRYKDYSKLLAADSLGDIENIKPMITSNNKKFKYTNLNYAFLGRILEVIYNERFENIANDYFKRKLDQDQNIYFITQKPDSIEMAKPYVLQGRKRYPHQFFVSDIWKPAALAVATSEGLTAFLRSHMNQEYIKQVMNYPKYVKKRWYYDGKDNEERYGYGFRLLFSDNNLIHIFHNGFMFGALTTIYYLPQYDIGFVGLTNTSGYPKQRIQFSSQILSIVKRSIINRTQLNKKTQSMMKIKQF